MTVHIVTDVQDGMNKYFRGQAFVAFCVGILFSIGFLIIDFPLAIGFGLFIGLLNMVPYLQLIAFIPTVLLALLKAADTGENFWWILFCAFLVFCIVQIIQDGLIVPKVMGKITGLNPAIILLSLSVWGGINGNCRYDYRFALYQLDAFLLSKIHTNKRKRIFRRDRTL